MRHPFNPLHAIHGILATLNSTIPRYHQVSRFFGPRILLHVPRKQVRLASQCDTSESDAASRVVERHGSFQTASPRWPSFTVQLESNQPMWNIVKLPSEQNWTKYFSKIPGHGHSDSILFYIDQVAFDCQRSFDSIWKLVRTVGCIVPTTRRATLYRSDLTRSRDILKIVYV